MRLDVQVIAARIRPRWQLDGDILSAIGTSLVVVAYFVTPTKAIGRHSDGQWYDVVQQLP